MFGLVASICLLHCFALLVSAHLTWLVAWLSCLPCRTWCNIIIIITIVYDRLRNQDPPVGHPQSIDTNTTRIGDALFHPFTGVAAPAVVTHPTSSIAISNQTANRLNGPESGVDSDDTKDLAARLDKNG
jgi:hypothetical protein